MTPASDQHPTVRRVVAARRDRDDPLILEVGKTTLRLRPPRTRRGGPAEVEIPIAWLYDHVLLAQAGLQVPTRPSSRRPRRATP